MLHADNVTFAYGTGDRVVLDGVTLTIPRGRCVGLLGPNGSGKTTLLRVLAGILSPRSGRVALDGQPVAAWSRRALARRIAVVPQEVHTTFDFTALDIVLMGRYPHLGPLELEGPADLAIARDAMIATGTSALESRPFATLSGGEKQRVVIASALAQASDVLLLDEPTASLDLGFQLDIATLLQRLSRERGVTMVVCTHDLNLAAAVCEEAVLLSHGRVQAAGPIEAVLTPEHIRALYHVHSDISRHPASGRLTVTPLGRA